jgi:hypothetical protein
VSNSQPRRLNGLFAPRAKKERRPAGVSRRRKKQLGFESLESRQVMSASAVVPFSLPNDPLFTSQWHLLNTGQQVGNPDYQDIFGVPGEDINVLPAWAMGYTGAGVTVAVVDSGIQLNHPDLAANINFGLGLDTIALSGNGNPVFNSTSAAHGTAVAGIIGAVANNGIGGAGIAPGVTLVPIRSIDPFALGAGDPDVIIKALRHANQEIDVMNHSWGPGLSRFLAGPTGAELDALRDSVVFGRGGLGIIHVFAAGNSAGSGFPNGFPDLGQLDSSGYNGWVNSRYVIGVTGVDHDGFYNNFDGTTTGYPETSAAVLVAAPTGSNAGIEIGEDTGIGAGIWTTDLTGDFGYNLAPDPFTGQDFDRDFLNDENFTSRFNGTSAAAPMVTGVIALMLEANPNLTWRDVQEILVRSARQNHPLTVPANGFEQGHQEDGTQNLWLVNQTPVFHDPDPFFPTIPIPAITRLFRPTLDPNISTIGDDPTDPDNRVMHYQATPFTMTNGAGYTVSMGRGTNGEQIGYGHGVIDAEMAVLLAEQWHTKKQALPKERSFTTFVATGGDEIPRPNFGHIPAREIGNQDTNFIMVPGGLGGQPGFISFWNEYTTDAPFSAPNGPENTRGLPIFFTVPDNNAMNIETVEVKISMSGGTAAAMDNLRILLVSPDGTHSELNHFFIEPAPQFSLQNFSRAMRIDDGIGSIDNGGDFVWTFSTKRSWGERSDNAIVYDASTGEPIINTTGIAPLSGAFPTPFTPQTIGTVIKQGWQLHFENYGTTPFDLNGVEVVWHGSPVQSNSQRVQGLVGVDNNRDGSFNYSRVIQQQFELIGDTPNTLRYGEIQTVVDPNLESFAGNITVTATRVSDGVVVDRFVTGHDGNFYFDLAPDEYIISIEDPQGRLAMNDSITPDGVLDKYRQEWHITEDYFKVWDHVSGSPGDVVVEANGNPRAWLDGNGDEVVTGMKGINFLLDPGEIPPAQASFSGVVYADTNGDGSFNGSDVALPNVTVFADVNRNGTRDDGEVFVQTDANGAYSLLAMGIASPTVLNVGVELPTNWTATNPTSGLHTRFVLPGSQVDSLDFFIKPPANNIGGGGANVPGFLLGAVFNDANNNGQRNGGEGGVAGVTVFLDANNNNVKDAGEVETTTNQFGAYVFAGVPQGQHVVRIVIDVPLPPSAVITTPVANASGHVVNLSGSSTVSALHFGVFDTAVYDFGDLPLSYDQRPLGGGNFTYDPARHLKGAYWLGASVDSEGSAAPSADADGDDLVGDDEDGVAFGTIAAGQTATITVTANTFTSYLQAWFDWNDDGDFNDAGERVLTDKLLQQGANNITFNVPMNVSVSNVYARFRLGEHSHDPVTTLPRAINTPWGRAATGEVEDYRVAVVPQAAPLVVGMPADFNQDHMVDGTDFLNWQRHVGMTHGATQAHGNANGNIDGAVNGIDLTAWEIQYGATASATSSSSSTAGSGSTVTTLGLFSGRNAGTSVTEPLGLDPSVAGWASINGLNGSGLVTRLNDLAERLRNDGHAHDRAAERIEVVVGKIADRFGIESLAVVQRDSAFESLFDAEDSENVLDDVAELATTTGSDAAFADLGRHFRRKR